MLKNRIISFVPNSLTDPVLVYPLLSVGDMLTQVEYDAAGAPLYIGRALAGSLTSEERWQIVKCTYDAAGNLTARQFAGGDNDYSAIWDDRATYTYA